MRIDYSILPGHEKKWEQHMVHISLWTCFPTRAFKALSKNCSQCLAKFLQHSKLNCMKLIQTKLYETDTLFAAELSTQLIKNPPQSFRKNSQGPISSHEGIIKKHYPNSRRFEVYQKNTFL